MPPDSSPIETAAPLKPGLAPWHWAIPFVMAAVSAPVWLGSWAGWSDWELTAFLTLNRLFSLLPDIVWSLLSLFGTGWAIYAVTAPALWRSPRIILSWLCAAPLAGVFTRLGKSLAASPRPLEVLGPDQGIHIIGEPLYIAAMPSGHTLTAFAGATAIYFALAPHSRRRHLWLFVFAAGVACSRIAVGAHWPADVVVGAASGVFCGLTGVWLAARIPQRHLRTDSWLMRGVALFGIYCLIVLWTDKMGFAVNLPFQYVLGAFLAACLMLFAGRSLRPV